MQNVSFELITMCYKFGKRARAMAYSIAESDRNAPLRMHAFIARQCDKDMIEEGNISGKSPIDISFTVLPETDIMKRAWHFNGYRAKGASHLVYMDSDLWFPQTFWTEYAKGLTSEALGYWSCKVLEIENPTEIINDYKKKVEGLAADVVRYEMYKGNVGHFQCVPSNYPYYPCAYKPSVEGTDLEFSKASIKISADKREERRIGAVPAYHMNHPFSWKGTNEEL